MSTSPNPTCRLPRGRDTFARVAAASIVLMSSSGAASPPPARPSASCANWQKTATTQMEMNACSAQDAQRSSRDVAKRYLDYRETLAGGRRSALDATQHAWAKYRDAYCGEKGAAFSGGSMQSMVVNTCVDTLNRRRALDLANDRNGSN